MQKQLSCSCFDQATNVHIQIVPGQFSMTITNLLENAATLKRQCQEELDSMKINQTRSESTMIICFLCAINTTLKVMK